MNGERTSTIAAPHMGLSRTEVERALAAARATVAVLEAALTNSEPDQDMGTKAAAAAWGVTENAALKRLKRIGRKGLDGRWSAPRSAIFAVGRGQDGAR